MCEELDDGDFRPDDQEIVGALLSPPAMGTAQNQLQLARELLERLEAGEKLEAAQQKN